MKTKRKLLLGSALLFLLSCCGDGIYESGDSAPADMDRG